MNSKDWFDLAFALTPLLALMVWLIWFMWRDNVRESKRHAAIMKQNAENFSNQDTVREERK